MSGAVLVGVLLVLALLVLPGRGGSGTSVARTGAPGPSSMTGARVRRRRPPARGRAADTDLRDLRDLLVLLEALEPALRAGLAVGAALVGPVADTRLGSALATADARGAPLGPVWAAEARRTGSAAAGVVHRTWRLSERVGSPLADGVADAREEVGAAVERRRRVAAAVAAPRATARLLTVLPLAGPPLALALGLRPAELWGGPGGPLALVGVVLVALGHLWCRALLRDITRPRPLADR